MARAFSKQPVPCRSQSHMVPSSPVRLMALSVNSLAVWWMPIVRVPSARFKRSCRDCCSTPASRIKSALRSWRAYCHDYQRHRSRATSQPRRVPTCCPRFCSSPPTSHLTLPPPPPPSRQPPPLFLSPSTLSLPGSPRPSPALLSSSLAARMRTLCSRCCCRASPPYRPPSARPRRRRCRQTYRRSRGTYSYPCGSVHRRS